MEASDSTAMLADSEDEASSVPPDELSGSLAGKKRPSSVETYAMVTRSAKKARGLALEAPLVEDPHRVRRRKRTSESGDTTPRAVRKLDFPDDDDDVSDSGISTISYPSVASTSTRASRKSLSGVAPLNYADVRLNFNKRSLYRKSSQTLTPANLSRICEAPADETLPRPTSESTIFPDTQPTIPLLPIPPCVTSHTPSHEPPQQASHSAETTESSNHSILIRAAAALAMLLALIAVTIALAEGGEHARSPGIGVNDVDLLLHEVQRTREQIKGEMLVRQNRDNPQSFALRYPTVTFTTAAFPPPPMLNITSFLNEDKWTAVHALNTSFASLLRRARQANNSWNISWVEFEVPSKVQIVLPPLVAASTPSAAAVDMYVASPASAQDDWLAQEQLDSLEGTLRSFAENEMQLENTQHADPQPTVELQEKGNAAIELGDFDSKTPTPDGLDYASAPRGGRVLLDSTSPCVRQKASWWPQMLSQVVPQTCVPSASTVLSYSTITSSSCYCMPGDRGRITIKLHTPITPRALVLVHWAAESELRTAPKGISVVGFPTTLVNTDLALQMEGEQLWFDLGSYEFIPNGWQKDASETIYQRFTVPQLDVSTGAPIPALQVFQVGFQSNHGSNRTCVYRVGILGN